MRRADKTLRNAIVSAVTYFGMLVSAFIVQRVLIGTMGEEYNGLNGLFTSIISMLSLADLGIGSAIIFHLYRPAEERDYKTVNSLLRFYKHCYMLISIVVLCIGFVIGFALPALVGDVVIADSIYLIFALFLADCLCSYFLAYKKSILLADQMKYVSDGIYFIVYMLQNALQIAVLIVFKSYIAFLVVKMLGKCLSNLGISLYIHKKYPEVRIRDAEQLMPEIRKDIVKKVRALFFHKVGKVLVTASDSIVITGVLGLTVMSTYTNYHMIIGGASALLKDMFISITNSVGNFLLNSSKEQNKDVYKKLDFLNFWLFGILTAGLFATIQPLVVLWLGESFLVGKWALLAMMLEMYLEGMRASVLSFKEAAGIFHEDRRIPVAEAVVNLLSSIALAYVWGLTGVIVGTIISKGIVYLYSYPKYICGPLMDMHTGEYYTQSIKHFIVLLLSMAMSDWCLGFLLPEEGAFLQLLISGVVTVVVFHLLLILFYGRSREMRYYIALVKEKMGR